MMLLRRMPDYGNNPIYSAKQNKNPWLSVQPVQSVFPKSAIGGGCCTWFVETFILLPYPFFHSGL